MGFTTKALHPTWGYKDKYGAMRCPIYQNAAFEFETAESLEEVFSGKKTGHMYSRTSNPSVEEFELKIKSIANAFGVLATATGMGAISSTLLALLKSGDNIITTQYLFGHSLSLFGTLFSDFGIEVRFVDANDMAMIEKNIDAKTKLLFCESISNPQLIVPDFLAISSVLKSHHIPLIVDTTMSPWNFFDAKAFGIDVEIISATKYIAGGGTVLGGLIIDNGTYDWGKCANIANFYTKFGANAFIAKLRKETFRNLGASLCAQSAYMLSLGIETMDLRVKKSCENALKLAQFLQTKQSVVTVNYPLLETSSAYEIASKQFSLGGAILTFTMEDKAKAYLVLNQLKLIKRGTNIQDNKSLAIAPYHTIYAEFSDEAKKEYLLHEGMIRLSVGIEDSEDLIEDLENALC